VELTKRLMERRDLFLSVEDVEGNEFFVKNGWLFQSTDELARITNGLATAGPLVGALVDDPSLRALAPGLTLGLTGIQRGMTTLDAFARPLSMAADTFDSVLANRPSSFSWREMLSGRRSNAGELRRLIEVRPKLDYSALAPGSASSNAIRAIVSELN